MCLQRDSFQTKKVLHLQGMNYVYYDLKKLPGTSRLPHSLKVLLENLLRHEDGIGVTKTDIENLLNWNAKANPSREISFMPSRVILQDFTGVPAVCDLAAMRDAMLELGGDPKKINPLLPAELVIDHSVQVDKYGTKTALAENAALEFERNQERYEFLRWGQKSFKNFKVVPPDTGIVHQVNLEYLAHVVFQSVSAQGTLLYPDSVVGTDSHTTMINGLGVLGWGVGGIEAEAAMLGQPIPLLIPQVIGVHIKGKLPEGTTSTDLVLTLTEKLRKQGVVGKFVEFFGEGLKHLTLADRATLSNMAPEFGCTCAYFPIDEQTIKYLELTGRSTETIAIIKAYTQAQGLFLEPGTQHPEFTDTVALDLGLIEACLAGPKRPQDRVTLNRVKQKFAEALPSLHANKTPTPKAISWEGHDFTIRDGQVVIAAITSCTNTSNPSVMIAAGLLAKKAVAKGLTVKPWVKTSLAPGSLVVTDYLKKSGLLKDLERLKFHVVGYGCTTCIGNSGPLPEPIAEAITEGNLVCTSVLSGNRNFEGRINPHVRANYLASPPLVVAYALAGRIDWDPVSEPIADGVYLKDIWPSNAEILEVLTKSVDAEMFKQRYASVFQGDKNWQTLNVPEGLSYQWHADSTYIQKPPFFIGMKKGISAIEDIEGARVLALLGDSITTDHISPAGSISGDSPAGKYLLSQGVTKQDFNSYGARRGNHHVMIRGTLANIRLRNQLAPGTEGGWTTKMPEGKVTSIFEAAEDYQQAGIPLLILAGKEYGSGSSRDWAAKGTRLLGVRAVIAESYERIHRSNLIGMGVLPLEFNANENPASLGLTGKEIYTITGLNSLKPMAQLEIKADQKRFNVIARIDTPVELDYYRHGGILQYVMRQILQNKNDDARLCE